MVQYFPVVTGSLTVTGSVNISGAITASGGISISGSIASASYADTASFVTLAQTASFVTTAQTASFVTTAQTASFVTTAQTASYVLNAVSSSLAATASSADNLLVRNTLTAQTLVVQTITSSVDFVTGSTRFGSLLTNTHVFSGSVTMNPNGLFVSGSGLVGIGTTAPNSKLDIRSSGLDTDVLSIYGTTGGAKMFDFRDDSASGVTAAMFRMYNSSGTETIRLFPGTVSVHHSWMLLSGNLGIGTTSPSSKLHLFSSTSGVSHRIESTATNGEPSINFYGKNSSGTVRSFAIKYDNADIVRFGTSDAISMQFETSDIARLTIASSGVATFSGTIVQSPSSGAGGFYIDRGTSSTSPYISWFNGSGTRLGYMGYSNTNVGLYLENSAAFTVTGGNVGIGIAAPDYKLDVNGVTQIRDTLLTTKQVGFNYTQTSTSGTTSLVNTGIFYNTSITGFGNNGTYLLAVTGNPNAAGSNEYRAVYLGYIFVTTGYDFGITNVVQRINYTQILTGDPLNIGALTISVVFWNGTTETTQQVNGTTNNQIRIKISGYNSSNIGAAQEVRLTKIIG